MKKLTVKDLVSQGYYASRKDIAKAANVTTAAVNNWVYHYRGVIPKKNIAQVIEHSNKPLTADMLASKDDCCKHEIADSKPVRATEFAVRVRDKLLSSWILALGTITE